MVNKNNNYMKKVLFSIALLVGLSSATYGVIQGESENAPKVYICQGSKSVCYHVTPDCYGLRKCSTQLKEISLDEAKKMGRRPCKVCCK